MDGETISFLVKLVEKSITEAGEKLAIRKKIVNILVESLQNILNYFAEESLDKSLENDTIIYLQYLEFIESNMGFDNLANIGFNKTNIF